MAHTPGEWEAIRPKKVGKHWRVGARGKLGGGGAIAGASVLYYVASIDNGAPGDTLETEEANARLIAAAPDAHEILLAIYEYFRHHGSPDPSALIDDDRTFKQAVESYFAKAGQGASPP